MTDNVHYTDAALAADIIEATRRLREVDEHQIRCREVLWNLRRLAVEREAQQEGGKP